MPIRTHFGLFILQVEIPQGNNVFDKQNIYIVILQTVPAFYMQIHTHVKLLNEVIVYKNFTEYMHESNRVIRLIVMHLSLTWVM